MFNTKKISLILFVSFFCVSMSVAEGHNNDFSSALRKEQLQVELKWACIQGDANKVVDLLEEGVNLNERYLFNWTSIMFASKPRYKNNAWYPKNKVVKILLKAGADPNMVSSSVSPSCLIGNDWDIDECGWTPLSIASYYGQLETAETLLNSTKIDPNKANTYGWTPLMFATMPNLKDPKLSCSGCSNKHKVWLPKNDLVELLLNNGAVPDKETISCGKDHHPWMSMSKCGDIDYRWSALKIASLCGYDKVSKMLLDRGASIDLADHNGVTALFHALNFRHFTRSKRKLEENLKIVSLFIDRDAEVNVENKISGATPLIRALTGGGVLLDIFHKVKALIDAGADTSVIAKWNGRTTLMLAVYTKDPRTVKMLIDEEVEVNAQDNRGFTALLIAAGIYEPEIVSILIKSRAKINHRNKHGDSALILTADTGDLATAEMLLNNNAELDYVNNEGKTALIIALDFRENKTAKMFINRGAGVNFIDKKGNSAFLYAVRNCSSGMANILADKGAGIEVVNYWGETALILAVDCGSVEIIKMLIEKNVDPDKKDRYGKTALDIAREGGCQECIVLLENHIEEIEKKRFEKEQNEIKASKLIEEENLSDEEKEYIRKLLRNSIEEIDNLSQDEREKLVLDIASFQPNKSQNDFSIWSVFLIQDACAVNPIVAIIVCIENPVCVGAFMALASKVYLDIQEAIRKNPGYYGKYTKENGLGYNDKSGVAKIDKEREEAQEIVGNVKSGGVIPPDDDGEGKKSSAKKTKDIDIDKEADRIANGHAYDKHVIKKGEFPRIKTKEEFAEHIKMVVRKHDGFRVLERGRSAYWHEETKTVVIRDPNHVDGGTVFRSEEGMKYFKELI